VTVVGFAVVGLGIIAIPLPGPGFLIVVAGLAILATEYVWARNALEKAKGRAAQAAEQATASPLRTALTIAFAIAMVGVGIALAVVERLPLSGYWTGVSLILGGLVLLTTTYLQRRNAATLEGGLTGDERLEL